jgi:hypothetical protein
MLALRGSVAKCGLRKDRARNRLDLPIEIFPHQFPIAIRHPPPVHRP